MQVKFGGRETVVMLAVCFGLASPASSQEQTQFFTPVQDTTLFEDPAGSLASGSGPFLFAGRNNAGTDSIRRALIKFDVSSIPPGSEILSTTLRLCVSNASTGHGVDDFSLVAAARDWGEGASSASGGGGAPAQPGDATWLHTSYDTAFWTVAGGDMAGAVQATQPVDGVGFYDWTSPAMAAQVEAWLLGENFGWMLTGDEDTPQTSRRFDSRENTMEENRPRLEVRFVPPVQNPLTTIEVIAEELIVAFQEVDADEDERLSFEEAQSARPGLTRAEFNHLDVNGDGVVSEAELQFVAGLFSTAGGCQCVQVVVSRTQALAENIRRAFLLLLVSAGIPITASVIRRNR